MELLLPEQLNFWQQTTLYILYVTAVVQFIFIWIIFFRFAFFTKAPVVDKENQEPVSVIIVARNEYKNLKKNLPKILEQDYPQFEVILVNHASEDDTVYLVRELQQKYPQLQYLEVQDEVNFFAGKKFPLSVGIKSAKNDLLLLTDADCYPASDQWIAEMTSKFSDRKSIVLGYGGYETRPGFLNKLIRFDALRVATLYLSFAKWGMPYMGVGRNLAYRRSLFFANNGFQSHLHIPSGDDDLFINSVARGRNTAIAVGKNCKTISESKTTLTDWYYQKRRHLTTGKHYRIKHLVILGLWDFSTIIFFIVSIFMLAIQFQALIAGAILGFRVLSQLLIVIKIMFLFSEKKLLVLSPLLELLLLIAGPILLINNTFFSNNRKW
jgi:glycosyltransferase involved in cell wall biosynthesis